MAVNAGGELDLDIAGFGDLKEEGAHFKKVGQ